LFSAEDETLLRRRDSFFLFDTLFDALNLVGRFNVDLDLKSKRNEIAKPLCVYQMAILPLCPSMSVFKIKDINSHLNK